MTKRLLLYFPRSETEKPIVYHLVKDYDLEINIFRAKVTPEEFGYLVLDVTGSEENIEGGISFVKTFDVRVDESTKGLRWEQQRCTSCGNCLTHCPTGALAVAEFDTRRVSFDDKLCVECLSCMANCPFGACSSLF